MPRKISCNSNVNDNGLARHGAFVADPQLMTSLSTAAWVAHDIGLATNIGGSLFGYLALEPALLEVSNDDDRDRASEKAWSRFSYAKLAGHAAFAVPWLVGRTMLSGREVSSCARQLTVAKDILVGASLITGVASFLLGRRISTKVKQGRGPEKENAESKRLERAVSIVGAVNALATVGVLAVTAVLAMEGSESVRFAAKSRRLP